MQNQSTKAAKSSIHKRSIVLSILIGTGIIAFLIFFYFSFSKSLQQEKKDQSKYLSEVGIGVIQYFHHLASSGKLTSYNAKRLVMNTLKSVSYGKNGYFWINNEQGVLLMQPHTPKRIGINQIDWTDITGKFIFRAFIKKAKKGGGWVSYYWPKPNSKQPYPKISYVAYFKPWKWILGTGIYIDDMQKNVSLAVIQASGILLACFITFIIIAFLVVNYFVRQLKELSIRDTLTNLYTKRFLKEILPAILGKHQRYKDRFLAVIFVDIDHFKKINDTYGHNRGDEVLKQIANVMINNTRPEDFCIRFGGEEFVVIGIFNDKTSIISITERIRDKVSQLIFSDKKADFSVTLSAGIAIHNSGEESFEDTIIRADEKLYQSKELGRNCVSM